MKLVGVFGALLLVIGVAAPVAAQEATYSITVGVFSDQNADGLRALDEDYISWTIELFDDQWQLVESFATDPATSTTAQLATMPRYVCAQPTAAAVLTTPLTQFSHPDDIAWYCFQNTNEEELFEFGIATVAEDIEEIGDILEDDPAPATDKVVEPQEGGAVLGANTDVLAETGIPAAIAPIVAVSIILVALKSAKLSKTRL